VPDGKLLILVPIFFLTSLISVVTGSTSLITVPVMIAIGIEPHVAPALVSSAFLQNHVTIFVITYKIAYSENIEPDGHQK
jgi:hypothetical protein